MAPSLGLEELLDRLSESRRFSWPVDAIHVCSAFYAAADEQAMDGRVCLLIFTGNRSNDGSTRLLPRSLCC